METDVLALQALESEEADMDAAKYPCTCTAAGRFTCTMNTTGCSTITTW